MFEWHVIKRVPAFTMAIPIWIELCSFVHSLRMELSFYFFPFISYDSSCCGCHFLLCLHLIFALLICQVDRRPRGNNINSHTNNLLKGIITHTQVELKLRAKRLLQPIITIIAFGQWQFIIFRVHLYIQWMYILFATFFPILSCILFFSSLTQLVSCSFCFNCCCI